MVQGGKQERADVLVGQGIQAPAARLLDSQQVVLAQDPQLMGNRRLLRAQRGGQIGNRPGPPSRSSMIRTRFGEDRANIVSASRSATASLTGGSPPATTLAGVALVLSPRRALGLTTYEESFML